MEVNVNGDGDFIILEARGTFDAALFDTYF